MREKPLEFVPRASEGQCNFRLPQSISGALFLSFLPAVTPEMRGAHSMEERELIQRGSSECKCNKEKSSLLENEMRMEMRLANREEREREELQNSPFRVGNGSDILVRVIEKIHSCYTDSNL